VDQEDDGPVMEIEKGCRCDYVVETDPEVVIRERIPRDACPVHGVWVMEEAK